MLEWIYSTRRATAPANRGMKSSERPIYYTSATISQVQALPRGIVMKMGSVLMCNIPSSRTLSKIYVKSQDPPLVTCPHFQVHVLDDPHGKYLDSMAGFQRQPDSGHILLVYGGEVHWSTTFSSKIRSLCGARCHFSSLEHAAKSVRRPPR